MPLFTQPSRAPREPARISPQSRKWIVLFVFSWVAGINQFLWLNLSPIISRIQKEYRISDIQVTMLLLVFPLIYVIFSYHSGRIIDRYGYRTSILFGFGWTAIFSLLRMWTSYWALLIAQIGIAIGQPYIVNAITKLVFDWFPFDQTALATGLGTVGIFLCEVVSLAISAPVVEALGFVLAMGIFASITWIACFAFYLWGVKCVRNSVSLPTTSIARDFWRKAKSRNSLLLFMGSFLGLGYFYALTDWIVAILATQGLNADQAG